MTAPPSTFRFNCTGFTTMPGSTAIVYFSTTIAPVLGVTAIWQTHAQYVPLRNISEAPRPRTGVDPVDTASVRGEGRVSQPDASRTALSTPIARSSLAW